MKNKSITLFFLIFFFCNFYVFCEDQVSDVMWDYRKTLLEYNLELSSAVEHEDNFTQVSYIENILTFNSILTHKIFHLYDLAWLSSNMVAHSDTVTVMGVFMERKELILELTEIMVEGIKYELARVKNNYAISIGRDILRTIRGLIQYLEAL